jgi:thioredoxin reductase (NADPH)
VSNPILFVVGDDAATLATLAGALERRFGADYRVWSDRSPASALARLQEACDRGESIALLIAEQWMPEMTGIDWLGRARELCPGASRCLVVSYGDGEGIALMHRAMVLGLLDSCLARPWGSPDDRLYPLVSELLGTWTRMTRDRVEIVRIVGGRWEPRCHELRELLEQNGVPSGLYEPESDEGRRLLRDVDHAGRLPVVVFHDGRHLVDPADAEVARVLGARTEPASDLYDLAVIGAGPSGLAAAVYGASEGLRTLVIERRALGGQAGSSSMIRNYLGFPRGIGGTELAIRAYEQAFALGAEFVFTREARGLAVRGTERIVTLAERTEVRARAVVVATGIAYNRLAAPGAEALVGKGVFYGAATTEARALAGQDVFIVGGGNSAGQAAVHLARCAARVTMVVRGSSLSASMSDYLIKQIERTRDIRVRLATQVVRVVGRQHLEMLELEDIDGGGLEQVPAAALFVMIGAGPHTDWLASALQRDERGYVRAGRTVLREASGGAPGWPLGRLPYPLETSLPGVFVAGDVRDRSVKRVASAVGEGAIAINSVHEYLADA